MGRMQNEYIRLQETPIMDECPECYGDMIVEKIVPIVRGVNVDVGFHDYVTENCYECEDGKVARLCECGEPVTLIMGPNATVCEMCKQ
jgi:hypothetical protein